MGLIVRNGLKIAYVSHIRVEFQDSNRYR